MGHYKHLSLALLLGVIALTAGTASLLYVRGRRPEPTDPQVKIDPKSDYRIESVSANKCVQLAGAPAVDGGEAQIWACNKSAAQRFHFDLLADGYYRIRQAGSNQCLDVADGSQDDGAAVKGFRWNGDPHQQWQVLAVSNGTVRLMARHSDKALDLWKEATNDGAALRQMYWKGSSNQQFRLRVVDRADR
jgi:alpha-galactosidase